MTAVVRHASGLSAYLIASLSCGHIAYTVTGTGTPPIPCLPQSSGPVGVGPFVEAVSKGFFVIGYDRRGTRGAIFGCVFPLNSPSAELSTELS